MRLHPVGFGLWLTVVSAAAAVDRGGEADEFVRLRRDKDKTPLALETSIVTFVPQDAARRGVVVELVGAIHIAEKGYYDELNRRFRTYDAVLYELVAREQENVPRPGMAPGSFIGGMQVGMKSLLGLEFQLDRIDYTRPNMVHADMSPEEFAETMKRRNESMTGMFFRLLGRSFAQQAKDPWNSGDLQILAALAAEDRPRRLKAVMAEQFADAEDEMDVFDGPDGSTIITERNKKALDVLRQQLQRGKKRLALFYGAGHLPDLERRLVKDFQLKKTQTQWLVAWSLTATPEKKP
jgi:hypothetical protein